MLDKKNTKSCLGYTGGTALASASVLRTAQPTPSVVRMARELAPRELQGHIVVTVRDFLPKPPITMSSNRHVLLGAIHHNVINLSLIQKTEVWTIRHNVINPSRGF